MECRRELLSREGTYAAELMNDQHALAFHQHGDIAYCELPFDGSGTGRQSRVSTVDYDVIRYSSLVMTKYHYRPRTVFVAS